jgi:glycosidase
MRQRLRFLYGREAGDRTYNELERLLDSFRARLPSPSPGRVFDQREALLITYGDSVLGGGRPPLAGLRDFAARHLADLISTIHILPFFPYSSDYGFSVVDYLRVNPDLDGWDDVAAIGADFKLMFDFVLNHVSAGSAWFQGFLRGEPPYDRYFITLDPRTDLSGVTRPRTTPLLTRVETANGERYIWTTFSADQVDLNYANPEVLLRMLDVMLTYVERGADLLRMDAVGYLWKEVGTSCIHLPQTHEVVKLFRDVLDEVAPQVAIVTETNVPHLDNVSYFGDGYDEAQMVYQFPLAPLVLDAFARSDTSHLSAWADDLAAPSAATTFFNFLASHDGIGLVPARGFLSEAEVQNLVQRALAHGGQVSYKTDPDGTESPYELNVTWFDALSDPNDRAEPWQTRLDRFICSQAILLALAGVPGVYIHSLLGSHNDLAGYARSGWKRDLNHERLDYVALERRLADPSAETAQVFRRYGALLRARRAQPAFHPSAPQAVLRAGSAVFALRRGPLHDQTILALHNVTNEPLVVDVAALDRDVGDRGYVDVLAGRASEHHARFPLGPYAVAWLARSSALGTA